MEQPRFARLDRTSPVGSASMITHSRLIKPGPGKIDWYTPLQWIVPCMLALLTPVAESPAAEPVPTIDFAHQIVPILRENCLECHGGNQANGGFSINTRELVLDAGVVESGHSADSYLLELVSSEDIDLRMPPEGKSPLSEQQIDLLRHWIDAGLPWEAGFTFAPTGYEPPLAPRRPDLPPATDGRANPIDRFLDRQLADQGRRLPGPIDDATFARRVYLDLVGLLPPPEKLQEFVASKEADKRRNLVQALLADRQAYAEHWLSFWNDLLRNDYAGTGYIDGGRKQISAWLYRSLLENKAYDQFTRELVAPTEESDGFIRGIKWRGNVNASQSREIQFAQNVSQVFLGMNLKCASCHDSFIDPWTLEETYNLAAVFSDRPLELHRCDQATGQVASPAWIYPELGRVDAEAPPPERLAQLARLMTSEENGRFARTIVNRLWHRLMGRGVIYPMEAMQTPPFNTDLLDWLAVDLVDHDYDLQHTLEQIATSQAYQSQTVSASDEQLGDSYRYRGPLVKRMTAEQFMDAIWQLTGTGPQKPDKSAAAFLPQGDRDHYRAALLQSDLLMRALGRPNREQVVTVRPTNLTRLQAIELFNSQILTDMLHRGAESLLDQQGDADARELVENVFLQAVSRPPTSEEWSTVGELISTPVSNEGLQDLLWTVIMMPEFQLIR